MTLYEYLEKCEDGMEVTVWDVDYDIETYFYAGQNSDDWDEAMMELARILEIKETNERGVTVNLSETIERKISQIEEAGLFVDCDVDSIMDSIEYILAGNVSEEWMVKFANAMKGE